MIDENELRASTQASINNLHLFCDMMRSVRELAMRERCDSEITDEQKRRYAEARGKFVEYAEEFQSRDVSAAMLELALYAKTHWSKDEQQELYERIGRVLA